MSRLAAAAIKSESSRVVATITSYGYSNWWIKAYWNARRMMNDLARKHDQYPDEEQQC